jgi:hypothetical protein
MSRGVAVQWQSKFEQWCLNAKKKKRIRALGGGMRAVSSFFKKYTTGITKYGHCIC